MKVLVDTAVWSAALRRTKRSPELPEASELRKLVIEGRAVLIGPIRQEVLSGIRESAQFERIQVKLGEFSDLPIDRTDYETAAAFFNRCRGKGIQGSGTDFLICAVAVRNRLPIFTTDKDFTLFKKMLPISLHTSSSTVR